MEQNKSASLRILVVWEPMLATDISGPKRPTLSLISDPRTAQFWDKDHLIAGDIKRQLNGNRPPCCEQSGYLWDLATIYPRGGRWESSSPQYDNGPIYKIAPQFGGKLAEVLAGEGAISDSSSR